MDRSLSFLSCDRRCRSNGKTLQTQWACNRHFSNLQTTSCNDKTVFAAATVAEAATVYSTSRCRSTTAGTTNNSRTRLRYKSVSPNYMHFTTHGCWLNQHVSVYIGATALTGATSTRVQSYFRITSGSLNSHRFYFQHVAANRHLRR